MSWAIRSVVVAFVVLCCADAHAQRHTVTVVSDVDYVADAEYADGKDRLDLYIPDGVRMPRSSFRCTAAC